LADHVSIVAAKYGSVVVDIAIVKLLLVY